MATKIRLQRHGRKSYAFYQIVVANSRAPRDGKFIERIGSYNPNTNPATVDLNFDRALYWLQVGAQPTDTARNILSREGVCLKKHLLEGVKKGAFDEAKAEEKFQAWKQNKQASFEAIKNKDAEAAKAAKAARLEAEQLAKEFGYPVMLKATAGGGGKGMRAVWAEDELLKAWEGARQESAAAFGNDGMYLEKLIEEPRHIEIQIVGDAYGKACHLSERDCSVQRRHQKLTEETPSPFMTDELRTKMGEAAVKAAEYIKYEGAGTVEFLVDKHRNFYFMEMNTRIQVEHPITEQVIDYDLIREQIMVAAGIPISGKNYLPQLHAIECRINAEDPYNDFRPSPGKITTLHMPGGHGVRLDTHVYSGYTIPPNYDSMIAKLITTAQSREEAISKMRRALDEFVIEGIKTTIPFHRQLMDDPRYIAGDYTTAFMDTFKMNNPE
mgnify:CR=1 FL=1